MKLAYFPEYTALNSGPVLKAFLDSARNHFSLVENSLDADAAVIWSVLWNGRMRSNQQVWDHYKKHNRPVIVIDVGALHRGRTWKIAVDSITADGYYGHQTNLDLDRPRKLGISLSVNTSSNPNIVIAAQHSSSLQTSRLESVERWIQEQIQSIRKVSDRHIVIRPHPRSRLDHRKLFLSAHESIQQPQKIVSTYDSYDLAFDCHALVNYNSGPGIQAALAGTRAIVDRTSLAWPVSTAIHDIENTYDIDRTRWLIEICHTEYTVEEIARGAWYSRLEPALKT